MTTKYTEIRNQFTNKTLCISCADIGSIPIDPNNKDYQDYLTWVAEGNTAEIAN